MHRGSNGTLATWLMAGALALPQGALASGGFSQTVVWTDGPPPAVRAEARISRPEAVAAARRLLGIPREWGEPRAEQADVMGPVWSLSWDIPEGRPGGLVPGGASALMDATSGAVLSYHRSGITGKPVVLGYTRKEAERVAGEWLDRLAPSVPDRLSLRPADARGDFRGMGEPVYEFQWVQTVDGHAVADGGVVAEVSARTGELVSYFSHLTWGQYRQPARALERADAEAIYARRVPMQLVYMPISRPDGEGIAAWRLAYRPLAEAMAAITQNGELVDRLGRPVAPAPAVRLEPLPAPERPYRAPAAPLAREEAVALARAVTGRADVPLEVRYSELEQPPGRRWIVTWVAPRGEEGKGSRLNVSIDAERGLVDSIYTWNDADPAPGLAPDRDLPAAKPVLSPAEAQARAIAFLRTYRPDLAGGLALQGGQQGYTVTFGELYKGIPLESGGVTVGFDPQTGRVSSFWGGGARGEEALPEPTGILTPDQAVAAFLRQQGLEQQWRSAPGEGVPAWELVWAPAAGPGPGYVDARTGDPVDYTGRKQPYGPAAPADIAGHVAEREIQIFWDLGLLQAPEGKFEPDRAVAPREAAGWLAAVTGWEPGAALARARAETVSREEFALWVLQAAGYGSVTRMSNPIAMPFRDREEIGPAYANAVAFLHGLGILRGDAAGRFEPRRALTRGEAVKIIFAALGEVRR